MECPNQKMRTYMSELEEEQRKILVFRRELPLCLDLVTQAIEACKLQLSAETTTTTTTASMEGIVNGTVSVCSEENSMKCPVLEEFIPIKRTSSSYDNHHTDDDDDDDEDIDDDEQHSHSYSSGNDMKKSNWLKSVQLWNPNPEAATPREDSPPPPKRGSLVDGKTSSGAFHPFLNIEEATRKRSSSGQSSGKEGAPPPPPAAASTSSSAEKGVGGSGKGEEKQKPSSKRKQRRCWSADLHRRFLHALQQLGGPQIATPKQIRELMKVEGLTNDEVKSHLQKYRLHAKGSPNNNNGSAQSPQFVVVGGIWMQPPPQPQYAAAAAAMAPGTAHGIYAPAATKPPAQMQVLRLAQQKSRGSTSEEFEAHGSSDYVTASSSAHSVSVC